MSRCVHLSKKRSNWFEVDSKKFKSMQCMLLRSTS